MIHWRWGKRMKGGLSSDSTEDLGMRLRDYIRRNRRYKDVPLVCWLYRLESPMNISVKFFLAAENKTKQKQKL